MFKTTIRKKFKVQIIKLKSNIGILKYQKKKRKFIKNKMNKHKSFKIRLLNQTIVLKIDKFIFIISYFIKFN